MVEPRCIRAGLLYCGVVFAAGFVLGVVRTLCVAPLAGGIVAVVLEAPVMLAIAWNACAWVSERYEVSHQFLDRLLMGALALALLICAEALTAVAAEGQSLNQFFSSYTDTAVLLGLMAQFAFALFPLMQRGPARRV